MTTNFKQKYKFESRRAESVRIKEKYPDRIPVIVNVADKSKLKLDKQKYLVPNDLTVGQFIYVIRRKISLKPEESLFMFINNTLPMTSQLLSQYYKSNADPDGFLYVVINEESTFG